MFIVAGILTVMLRLWLLRARSALDKDNAASFHILENDEAWSDEPGV